VCSIGTTTTPLFRTKPAGAPNLRLVGVDDTTGGASLFLILT
jgi:hypothetical protein